MAERGWTLDQVKAEIEKRKPDFDKFVAPQKQVADAVIQVLPTALTNGTASHSLSSRSTSRKSSGRSDSKAPDGPGMRGESPLSDPFKEQRFRG